jgi:NOL1/NOP2/sun family putative RNA methylase
MIPESFSKRMKELLKDEYDSFIHCLENEDAVKAIRVNTLKTAVFSFLNETCFDLTPLPYAKDGFILDEAGGIGNSPEHHSGMIYVQDPGAMATVNALDVEEGWRVLDMCSAPGGKSGQAAARIGDGGFLLANEFVPKRAKITVSNFERLGIRCAIVTSLDTKELPKMFKAYFDLVIADVPCSGEGMFRKNDRAIEEWSLDNVRMCADRQREILSNVVKCVAPGGKLIYSTCTFSLEENEMNVAWLLDSFTDFKLVEVDPALKAVTSDGICFDGCEHDMTKARRFYPHVSKGEGQFVAVFERDEGVIAEADEPKLKKKDKKKKSANDGIRRDDAILLEAANEFLRENLCDGFENGAKYELISLGGKAYLKPDIDLPKYGVFAAGVCVGEIVGKKFTPHHQLFSAFGNSFIRRVLLEQGNPDTDAYLKGLEFDAKDICSSGKSDGWAAVLVDGCPVGGGKIVDGKCKNHYPKGLRNKQ